MLHQTSSSTSKRKSISMPPNDLEPCLIQCVALCFFVYYSDHHYSKSPKYKWTKAQFRFEPRPVYTLAETVVVQHNLCSCALVLYCWALVLYCCALVLCCSAFVLCCCTLVLLCSFVVLLCWSRGVSRLSSVPKAIQTEAAAILQQQLLSNRDKTAIKYLFIDIHIGAVHW